MPENTINGEKNESLKIQLSLASLMFFSPFIKFMLNKYELQINDNDMNFIKWYMYLGWINIALLLISIVLWVGDYIRGFPFVNMVYMALMVILILSLIVWCICIFTDTNIISTGSKDKSSITPVIIEWKKSDMLLDYLPVFNIYRRYKDHNFDKPNIILKESIIIWWIVALFCMTWNITILSIILMIIITRMVTLINNIDIIPNKIRIFISQLFTKNPEELFWYIKWLLLFIGKTLIHRQISLQESINIEKQKYSYLYNIKKIWFIQLQYILTIAGLSTVCWQFGLSPTTEFEYVARWLILSRYLVMIFAWQHLPAIPVFNEIVEWLLYIKNKIKNEN